MRLGVSMAAIGLALAAPLAAQTPPHQVMIVPPPPGSPVTADPAFQPRLDSLVPILAGSGDYDDVFAFNFRAAVPKAQFDAIATQLRQALGAPLGVSVTRQVTAWSAEIAIRYEHGTASASISVEPSATHPITGLRLTGTQVAGDTIDKLLADFRALPGASGFAMEALGTGAPRSVAGLNADTVAPVGSAFKLWVLAELAREIAAGQRHWVDVVPLAPASLPSGITQTWPAATPATLQSLATLMIAISDNTAADTLVGVTKAGLEAMVATAGAADPARTLPFLTTREAFALKVPANADLRAAWEKAGLAERRRLLDANRARLAATPIDAAVFQSGQPVFPDTIEWFASPHDMARLLDWLRLHGDATTQAILAVNAGTDPATKAKFAYIGFKGGSEPGVIALNYLVRTPAGRWLAVTGNWHRPDAEVNALVFTGLMNRALALAAAG